MKGPANLVLNKVYCMRGIDVTLSLMDNHSQVILPNHQMTRHLNQRVILVKKLCIQNKVLWSHAWIITFRNITKILNWTKIYYCSDGEIVTSTIFLNLKSWNTGTSHTTSKLECGCICVNHELISKFTISYLIMTGIMW